MDNERRHPERIHEPPFLIFFLAVICAFLVGTVFSENIQGSPATIVQPDNAFAEELAVAQLTALVSTMTPVIGTPTRTATPIVLIVTVTPTATHELPWCDYAKSGEPCYQPGVAPTATAETPRCDEVTPMPYSYVCRKTDTAGTSRDDSVD